MHGYHTQKQQGWILSGRLRWEEGINSCHITQRVGLNLCGTFLLFFSARALNYAAAGIPYQLHLHLFLRPAEKQNSPHCSCRPVHFRRDKAYSNRKQVRGQINITTLACYWKPLTLQMKTRCCSTRLP